ncbi:MAG: sigma factor-like helix-turn-helix DNA-binding protein [Candidatus Solibacter sp.]
MPHVRLQALVRRSKCQALEEVGGRGRIGAVGKAQALGGAHHGEGLLPAPLADRREIGRIPPILRHALVLREVNQLPMPEVAEQLGISLAAAKSRLLRGRSELWHRLEKYCGQMGAAPLTA